MSRNIYGLDLGSYEIKVYDKKQKTIWREKMRLHLRMKRKFLQSEMRHMRCMGKHLITSALYFR